MIPPNSKIELPQDELAFRASRSSGPGGQNVNKLSTKVTVLFKISDSQYLSDSQKRLIAKKLVPRISSDGVIAVSSQKSRSQLDNRNDAIERLNQILTSALKVQKRRIKTTPSRGSVRKRLEAKKRRGALKSQRAKKFTAED